MLALEMDGKPLSRPHGSPARVVIPEMYGYKGVKWLTRIELVDHQPTGYWEGLGYDQNAWVGRSNGYALRLIARLRRWTRTERAVHWIHATAFCVLLGSGLCLYLPSLAEAVGRRPLAEVDPHLHGGRVGGRARARVRARRPPRRCGGRCARSTVRRRRPRLAPGPHAPQGRLNAGQKLNTIVTAAFAILFAVSGFFLWYGERDTRFRLANALLVHDWLMYVSLVLFLGHL